MDFILNGVQFFVSLGPAVMLPIVIFIVGLILGQSAGKALRSGISIGIGFIGIGLVIPLPGPVRSPWSPFPWPSPSTS